MRWKSFFLVFSFFIFWCWFTYSLPLLRWLYNIAKKDNQIFEINPRRRWRCCCRQNDNTMEKKNEMENEEEKKVVKTFVRSLLHFQFVFCWISLSCDVFWVFFTSHSFILFTDVILPLPRFFYTSTMEMTLKSHWKIHKDLSEFTTKDSLKRFFPTFTTGWWWWWCVCDETCNWWQNRKTWNSFCFDNGPKKKPKKKKIQSSWNFLIIISSPVVWYPLRIHRRMWFFTTRSIFRVSKRRNKRS